MLNYIEGFKKERERWTQTERAGYVSLIKYHPPYCIRRQHRSATSWDRGFSCASPLLYHNLHKLRKKIPVLEIEQIVRSSISCIIYRKYKELTQVPCFQSTKWHRKKKRKKERNCRSQNL